MKKTDDDKTKNTDYFWLADRIDVEEQRKRTLKNGLLRALRSQGMPKKIDNQGR